MEEKELIVKLQSLKQIKPRQDWALLTKSQIIGSITQEEYKPSFGAPFSIFNWRFGVLKPALAFSTFALLAGLFIWTQGSLPGDTLYPVKQAAQQASFLADDQTTSLNMATKSARALKEIVTRNEVGKLAPAIEEYQDNLKKATASLDNPPKKSDEVLKIAAMVNQIEKETKDIESVLQTEIAKAEREELAKKARAVLTRELEEAQSELARVAAEEIRTLGGVSMTEEQQDLFERAKESYDKGDYVTTLQLLMGFFE